jgi:hypothetical protein
MRPHLGLLPRGETDAWSTSRRLAWRAAKHQPAREERHQPTARLQRQGRLEPLRLPWTVLWVASIASTTPRYDAASASLILRLWLDSLCWSRSVDYLVWIRSVSNDWSAVSWQIMEIELAVDRPGYQDFSSPEVLGYIVFTSPFPHKQRYYRR